MLHINSQKMTNLYDQIHESRFIFFLFIVFIGVTLAYKIIQVSGAQFYSTSSVHRNVCSPPRSSPLPSHFIPLYTPAPPLPLTPAITTLLSMPVNVFLFCSVPSSPSPQPPTAVGPPSIYEPVSAFLLVQFVHQIPHMSEIIWYLSFSDWLISLSIMLFRPIHAVTKGKVSFFFMAEEYPSV